MKILLALLLVAGPLAEQQPENIPLPAGANVSALLDHGGYAQVSFRMLRETSKPPQYSLSISSDGTGVYREGAEPAESGAPIRKITVSVRTWQRLLAGAKAVEAGECETKLKNIAQTGKKHISYSWKTSDVALPQCDFNYSDDAALNDATSAFQAIAETIQAGDRLKWKKRFDHLGLDAELDGLISQVKSGYAIELQNIAPVLHSIADDDEFLASSRRKATSLLTMAAGPMEQKS